MWLKAASAMLQDNCSDFVRPAYKPMPVIARVYRRFILGYGFETDKLFVRIQVQAQRQQPREIDPAYCLARTYVCMNSARVSRGDRTDSYDFVFVYLHVS